MITIEELAEQLETFSEVDLLEILEIDSKELVARFMDKIEDNYDKLLVETYGGKGDNDQEKENKIIRNIAKEVTIEKT